MITVKTVIVIVVVLIVIKWIVVILTVIITIALIVLVARLAKNRNRDVLLWVVLSLIFNPIVIIIALIYLGDNENCDY